MTDLVKRAMFKVNQGSVSNLDIKQLIDDLYCCSAPDSEPCNWCTYHKKKTCDGQNTIKKDASKALETLLKAFDVAQEQLQGKCWACAHAKEIRIGCKTLYTCEYMKQRGVVCCSGNDTCEHWEWNGGQAK